MANVSGIMSLENCWVETECVCTQTLKAKSRLGRMGYTIHILNEKCRPKTSEKPLVTWNLSRTSWRFLEGFDLFTFSK